ncbi:SpoIVB peptidase S55 domain-containing protein [Nocardioides lijunqiniae]|uniref:SpoIVB peptidase S55 domain-containing protein n=1 Tax=Nocardioides lijunqiniae TaxID=2760832 RepID=UPI0018780680|nr:SpoIVB peptidase S55 domain-containing protein [Nocardioides lijunqiniae]
MSRPLARRRALVALASSVGLVAGATAYTSPPAGSAPPAGDCTPAFPLAEVTAGQSVKGLTVDSGVTPEPFTGEVIGVLDDGVAAGIDMIIMKLDSAALQDAGGIWQGMSGSPVYDATDNRLIGAVAYGLSYGPSPIAGITPIEDMDDYLETAARAPQRVDIGAPMAKRIARASDVTAREASQGARPLPMPLGVSGVSARRLASVKTRPYVTKGAYAVGRAAAAAGPADIVAGGNIAGTFAYGDVTAGGVGTATTVCDGRVVAFGHPMMFSGPSTMAMHPAEALFVQPDSLGSPFKVANIAAPTGTFTDDRLTGITGTFDELPETIAVTSKLTMGSRSREGTTQVSVPAAAAEMTFYQLVGNHDRVVDGSAGGTETQSWTIKGTDAAGKAFTISRSDRITSRSELSFEASMELPDVVYALSDLPGVTIDSITADGVVTSNTSTYRITAMQQLRKRTWVTINRRNPATVRAGGTLHLRAVLSGPGGQKLVRSQFTVPKRAKGLRGLVAFSGGSSGFYEGGDGEEYEEEYYFEESEPTLADIIKSVKEELRNDQLRADMIVAGRRVSIERTKVLGPVDQVVRGQRMVPVRVR